MRTNVRSGRGGCPRGQRVGALLSNLLIAGMRTCCAPFTPLGQKPGVQLAAIDVHNHAMPLPLLEWFERTRLSASNTGPRRPE